MNVVCSGPEYEGYEVDGNKIRIRFSSTNKGLVAKGDKLEGFTIAGADHKFHWAEAKIVGNCVEVSCKDVPRPSGRTLRMGTQPIGQPLQRRGIVRITFPHRLLAGCNNQ